MAIAVFGRVGDEDVREVVLKSAAGAQLRLLSWGCVVQSMKLPVGGTLREVTLGFDKMQGYLDNRGHFGALAGRVANRISGASFVLDGVRHTLVPNQDGNITLHGGGSPHGFGVRNWQFVGHDATSATLKLTSPDGEGGFPGALETIAKISLDGLNVIFELEAHTDKPTVVNLAQHSYFNLAGRGDVLDHRLQVEADFHTPTDEQNMTTGEIRHVEGTAFDFRAARPIRYGTPHCGYDGNFALRGQPGSLRRAATLSVDDLALDMWTTEPGMQIYDAPKMNITGGQGIDGRDYGACGGFCMECQHFADAPNKPWFPSIVLRPGETYRQRTEWRFRV